MRYASLGLLLGGVVLSAAGGCSSKGTTTRVALSAGTGATTVQGARASAALDGGNGLTIERIRLVVRRVEVEAPEGSACTPTSGGDGGSGNSAETNGADGQGAVTAAASAGGSREDGSVDSGQDESGDGEGDCEFGGGPFLVDLSGAALDGGIHWVAAIDVPAGTYEEAKFVINTIPSSLAGGDAGLQAMADAHSSIRIDGTLGGAPFAFSTPIEVQQKREGEITVDPATSTNLTLDVDPTGWFKAADGTLLSPDDPTAAGAILANIRASIRIVHDDDRDGHDDEHDGS